MSEVKVNKISPRTNCGTVTLGDSGDTIALGSGASQTGFGRTGTVDWVTTVKTNSDSPLTAVDGKGYFLNTTSGAITVNLPAGAAGSIVAFKDYANTWDTNNVTVTPNGSEKIGGVAASANFTTESQSVTLIYIDSTKGWMDIHDSTSDARGATYISASVSGACNTLTTVDTNYKVAKFVGPGTFTVCSVGNPGGSTTVDYLVIAGGGGGGYNSGSPPDQGRGGGGGAGGYRESSGTASGSYTVSPLGSGVSALPVSATGYPITVGAGVSSGTPGSPPAVGSNSVFSTVTSSGGGRGGIGTNSPDFRTGTAGGSGGGGGTYAGNGPGGAGNTPPVSPPQGNTGGLGVEGAPAYGGGGGGGATAVGVAGTTSKGGDGGTGGTSSIDGTPTERAGGGGGATLDTAPSRGLGVGGGGDGAAKGCAPSTGGSGTANTGGGGGGSGGPQFGGTGGTGGSGVVFIRYKFQ
jgi:hypothetical protein